MLLIHSHHQLRNPIDVGQFRLHRLESTAKVVPFLLQLPNRQPPQTRQEFVPAFQILTLQTVQLVISLHRRRSIDPHLPTIPNRLHACLVRQVAFVLGLGSELLRRVGEKTHLSLARQARIANPGPVPGRMEPVLEHAVSELTGVALQAMAVPEGGACDGGVVELPRVTPLRFLAAVGVRALRPVVAPRPRAALDLVRVHPELVGGVARKLFNEITEVGSGEIHLRELVVKKGVDFYRGDQ